MALSADELLELKKALDTPGAINDDAYRSWALEQVQSAEDSSLAGWAGAGGTRADSAPPVPGSLGLQGIIGQEAPPDEAETLAGQMDPRYDLIPQALAIQPATTHPGGDAAAEAEAKSGQTGEARFAYEPPVSLVQKQLVENPAFLRLLRPSAPPSLDEIGALDETSELYKDAANWMWRKTAEAAAKNGQTVYRYSQTPYLWGTAGEGGAQGSGALDQLKLKLGASGPPLIDLSKSFVLGADDTATLGVGRAAQETLQPEMPANPGGADYMGLNESVPQSTAETNRWTTEGHPYAHAGGQALAALAPWGAAARLFEGVATGGRFIANAAAKTRLGALAGRSRLATAAGRAGVDAAAGGVAAGAEETGRQAVDVTAESVQSGEAPSLDRLAEAGERVRDVGESGAYWGGGGSLAASGASAGAQGIRQSPRFTGPRGPGAVGRTEANMEYRFGREPRLSGETRALVKEANEGGYQPGDVLTESIAPPVRDMALADVKKAKEGALAERRNYQASPEGSTPKTVSHLERMSLEKLRDHHQPQADGALRPVDETYRDAQKVFNRHIDSVSLEPTKGAIELTADEAGAFLNTRARGQLLKADIEAAAERQAKQHFDRKAYLEKQPAAKRAAIDEEIQASIDDLLQQKKGDRALDVDQRSAAYKDAEQQVLRERYGGEVVLEPFGGSFAEYLKQRGKDTVYVKPAAYDARRADTLVEGLKDPDLIEAAKYDRQQFTKGGERGGYELMRRKQDQQIAAKEKTAERVAPGGDAFQPVAGLYQSRPGEKQLVDEVKGLADRAGVSEQFDRLRGLQETLAIQNRASFRGPQGQTRSPFAPQNAMDAAQLRLAFPVLKALEGPLGPLGAGKGGRAAIIGQAPAAPPGESSARSRYEDARERRLRELAAEKNEEKERRDKRRQRRAAGRSP